MTRNPGQAEPLKMRDSISLRPRATSITSFRSPALRSPGFRSLRSPGLRESDIRPSSFVANGVLHPAHMAEPGAEGYRTPTGEDFQNQDDLRRRIMERFLQGEETNPQMLARVLSSAIIDEAEDSDSSKTATPSVNELTIAIRDRSPVGRLKHAAHLLSLDWKQRIRHFTWSYFSITMATGGIANVLFRVPFHFNGLYALGCTFFLLNIVLFIINVICISLRFYYHPSTFKASFLHPTESLFAPAAVVSFGTILMNISQYGVGHTGEWLNMAVVALFWIDVAIAFIASFGIYLLFWSTQTFTIATMTPAWIFPAYPLLIIGPHAGTLSTLLPHELGAQVLVGGFTAQGIGLMISLMVFSAYIYRLMTQKLPLDPLRPGMFMSVGPCAFTASGLTDMSANAQRIWAGTDFMGNGDLAGMILRVVGQWTSLWYWGLGLWFFCVALGAHYSLCTGRHRMPFAMTWFSFVFPQTALVTSTFAIGRSFDLFPLQVIGCVMTVALFCVWLFVVFMMIRGIYLKQILWPQKGEDKDEGGFRGEETSDTKRISRIERALDASERV